MYGSRRTADADKAHPARDQMCPYHVHLFPQGSHGTDLPQLLLQEEARSIKLRNRTSWDLGKLYNLPHCCVPVHRLEIKLPPREVIFLNACPTVSAGYMLLPTFYPFPKRHPAKITGLCSQNLLYEPKVWPKLPPFPLAWILNPGTQKG